MYLEHTSNTEGKIYEIRPDRFRERRPPSMIGDIMSNVSIDEARGAAKHIISTSNDVTSLKDNFDIISTWCKKQDILSDKISKVNTAYNTYRHMKLWIGDTEFRSEISNFASSVLQHISPQSPECLQGSIEPSDKATREIRETMKNVVENYQKIDIEVLKDSFDRIGKWHQDNYALLRDHLSNNTLEEIDTLYSNITTTLSNSNNTESTSTDLNHKFRARVSKYTNHMHFANHVADIWRVGKDKPIGSIAIGNLNQESKSLLRQIATDAKERGLRALISHGINRSGPSLLIYDPKLLGELLQSNTSILEKAGWSFNVDDFAHRVCSERVPDKTELYTLIAKAFADHTNPARTDVEVQL